ncbi:hypothetical protein J6590_008920 [Homalodisca vitripennis]|nr:hypothetical protein J6590_008920 [Homalodisca vitripennis]
MLLYMIDKKVWARPAKLRSISSEPPSNLELKHPDLVNLFGRDLASTRTSAEPRKSRQMTSGRYQTIPSPPQEEIKFRWTSGTPTIETRERNATSFVCIGFI